MQKVIKCKNCGSEIEISDALFHQLEEQVASTLAVQHKKELEEASKIAEEEVKRRVGRAVELQVNNLQRENEEEKERNKKLTLQMEQLLQELRELRRRDEERELELKKKLVEEEGKIREGAVRDTEERLKMRELEKDKTIDDLKKALDDAQRRASQGSQQLQGEVQELDLEETLHRLFPTDEILEVKKGELGADVRQIVKSRLGNVCGIILWESKRTKAWSEGWISKLKEDVRRDKAHFGVIISEVLPNDFKREIGFRNGIWVTKPSSIEPLALLLWRNLYDVARVKNTALSKQTKAEEMYDLITSHEFVQQMERMIEIYMEMKQQVSRERAQSERSWKQRETQVDRLLAGVSGIYGSISGIAGSALPQIKSLQSGDNGE